MRSRGLYKSASVYGDALKNFIQGYQEELKRVMEARDAKSHEQDNIPK